MLLAVAKTGSLPFAILIGMILGPGLLICGVWRLCREVRPRWWRPVVAQIVSSTTKIERIDAGRSQAIPLVEYQYEYNGVTGTGFANLFCLGTPDSAEEVAKRYPAGEEITVLVNPNRPQQSSFGMQINPTTILYVLAGAGFLWLEIWVLETTRW
jgi:hypothetical protein